MEIGKRLIPSVIDSLASTNPGDTWAAYSTSFENLEKGQLQNVTWKTFSNAIDRLSWWLVEHIGKGNNLETLCYLGPSDIRYFIFAIAACKTGYKALFTSPRNQLAAHLSLIEKTNCKTLVAVKSPTVREIQDESAVTHIEAPTLEELLDEKDVPRYEYTKSFEEAVDQPFLVLHTSGSTGLPKPVEITHGLMACVDAQKNLPPVNDRPVTTRYYRDTDVYTALPPFHSAGINFFGFSVFQGTRLILGPPDKLPSVEIIQQMLNHNLARAGVAAPSILEELSESPELVKKLSSWNSVSFGGGPLPLKAGNVLSEYTTVFNILGSTETKNIPELVPEAAEDWQYHEFHPSLGIDFRPHADNLYELIFTKQPKDGLYHAPFCTFPGVEEYSMKDLYSPHPTKKGLWSYQGRADDIIVLANGEKFNPVQAEQIITSHPDVKSALIVGATKEQTAVLIEPVATAVGESVMDVVAKANEVLPGHAKLDQDHVKSMKDPNTFLRGTKGTVQRAPTVKKLKDEIEGIYQAADTSSNTHQLDFANNNSLQDSIVAALSKVGLRAVESLGVDDDLFAFGLDSLHSFKLARTLQSSLGDARVTKRIVYSNPTVAKLAKALVALKNGDEHQEDHEVQAAAQMQSLLLSCVSSLESETTDVDEPSTDSKPTNVVLTGSTGGLGSYLSDVLLRYPQINLTCLNRSGSGKEKQSTINSEKGLEVDFSRIDFLEGDLTQERFGLSQERFNILKIQTTHIVHNAWPVNFNLPISAFEDQVRGCQNLISFSKQSANRPHIHFISSVGAANRWSAKEEGPVPERALSDYSLSDNMGYAQSKQISELLFDHASRKFGVSSTICRVGQITGPVKRDQGRWNDSEWFPSLIRSSRYLGKLPDRLGAMNRLDWIPVDVLAEVVVETMSGLDDQENHENVSEESDTSAKDTSVPPSLSHSRATSASSLEMGASTPASTISDPSVSSDDKTGAEFIHLVNPHESDWQELIPHVQGSTEVVTFEEWLEALQASAEKEDGEEDNPAIKLLDFYEEIKVSLKPKFSTEMAEKRSRTLATMQPVSPDWMRHWMKQWGFV